MKHISKLRSRKGLVVVSAVTLMGLIGAFAYEGDHKAKALPQASRSRDVSFVQVDPEAYRQLSELKRPARDAMDVAYERYNAGDLEGCLKAAQRAAQIAENPEAHAPTILITMERFMGYVLLRQGKPQEALAVLQKHWQRGEDPRGADLDIALCYVRLGDPQRASQFYSDQAILGLNRTVSATDLPQGRSAKDLEAKILLARGSSMFSSGRFAEAALDYQKAVELVPRNALAHFKLAEASPAVEREKRALHFAFAYLNGSPKIRKKAQNGLADADRAVQAKAISAAKLMR